MQRKLKQQELQREWVNMNAYTNRRGSRMNNHENGKVVPFGMPYMDAPKSGLEMYQLENATRDWSYSANNQNSGSLGELMRGQTEYKNTTNTGRLKQLAAGGDKFAQNELLSLEYQSMQDYNLALDDKRHELRSNIAGNKYEANNNGLTRNEHMVNTLGNRKAATGEYNAITSHNANTISRDNNIRTTDTSRDNNIRTNNASISNSGRTSMNKAHELNSKTIEGPDGSMYKYNLKNDAYEKIITGNKGDKERLVQVNDSFGTLLEVDNILSDIDASVLADEEAGFNVKVLRKETLQSILAQLDTAVNLGSLEILSTGVLGVNPTDADVAFAKAIKAGGLFDATTGEMRQNLSPEAVMSFVSNLRIINNKAIAKSEMISKGNGKQLSVMQLKQLDKDYPYVTMAGGTTSHTKRNTKSDQW